MAAASVFTVFLLAFISSISGHGESPGMIWLEDAVSEWPGNVIFATVQDSHVVACKSMDEEPKLNWYEQTSNGEWRRVSQTGSVLHVKVSQPGRKLYTCKSEKHPEWHNVTLTVYHRGSNDEVITTPKSKQATLSDYHEYMDLTCDLSKKVKRVGETHHLWSLYGQRIESSRRIMNYQNGTLRIHYPGPRDSGVYMCEFYNETNALIALDFFEVKGQGYAHQDHQASKNYMQSDSVTVDCDVYGFPQPKVTWLRDYEPLTNDSKRVFLGKNEKGIANTTLRIVDLQYDDRAEYTCVATNLIGSGNVTTLVRVKDKLAALWPFLGIVAEVLFLVTIIFIYEKRHAKQEQAEERPVDPDRARFLPPGEDSEGARQRNVNA